MFKKLLLGLVLAGIASAASAQDPARFQNGINTVPADHWMAERNFPNVQFPLRATQWFDDFCKYTAGDWVLTTTEAGAGDATEALADEDRCVLLITNDAADDDKDVFQTVGEIFSFSGSKKLYFEARFKVSDATQSDFVMGLGIRDTTPLATTDFVGFQKDDGDALLDFHSISNSVDTAATALHSMVAAQYTTVAFYYDGQSTILVAVNNVLKTTITTAPSGTEMTVSFGLQNGEAVAKTMSVDYILAVKER